MKDRIFKKSKRGVSLVEEICAVCILAIGVFAAVAAIGLSRTSVVSDSMQETAAAQAQELADNLIAALSQNSTVPKEIDKVGQKVDVGGVKAMNVGDESNFSASGAAKQFCISTDPLRELNPDYIKGHYIVCRVYYNGGKNFVQMKAYASARGNSSP